MLLLCDVFRCRPHCRALAPSRFLSVHQQNETLRGFIALKRTHSIHKGELSFSILRSSLFVDTTLPARIAAVECVIKSGSLYCCFSHTGEQFARCTVQSLLLLSSRTDAQRISVVVISTTPVEGTDENPKGKKFRLSYRYIGNWSVLWLDVSHSHIHYMCLVYAMVSTRGKQNAF